MTSRTGRNFGPYLLLRGPTPANRFKLRLNADGLKLPLRSNEHD